LAVQASALPRPSFTVASLKCMSFVPAPQKANAAASAVVPTAPTAVTTAEVSDFDLQFKIHTFDVFWIEKNALMYRDGYAKVGLTDV
jgi:hypothetical protein